MTKLSNGTIVTDIHNNTDNQTLTAQGYTVRHITTYLNHNTTCIVWDTPAINENDLPF